MNAIILLFLIGVLLLFFEVFMPGGVMGVMGGLAMLGGCVVAFSQYGPTGGMLAAVAALALIGLMLYFEFGVLPKTRVGKRFFLRSAVAATSQLPLAQSESVLGKTCEAITTLAPSGYVLLDGKRFEAFSQSGHVPKGTLLKVSGLDNFRLIVTKP